MKRELMDKENVVVAHQDETGVYVTQGGYVAIRQRHEMEDDSVVLIAPANVDAVIKAMKDSIKEAVVARHEYLFWDDADAS